MSTSTIPPKVCRSQGCQCRTLGQSIIFVNSNSTEFTGVNIEPNLLQVFKLEFTIHCKTPRHFL